MTPVLVPRFRLLGIEELSRKLGAAAAAKIKKLGDFEIVVLAGGGARSTDTNTMIAKVQAKAGRDPWYVSKAFRAELARMIKKAVVARGPDPAWDEQALKALGDRLLDAVRANVAAQRNPGGGTFQPLTAGYAKEKRKAVGFEKPILRRTGELLDSLRVVVRRTVR